MTWIRKGPSPRLTPEDAPLVASMVARAKDRPGGCPIEVLMAVAAEPDGARRKVAANVLGYVARGDAAIAAALRRLLVDRLDQPWIARHYAQALGSIGVFDPETLSALRRLRSVDSMSSAHRVAAREAIAKLSPPKAPR